MYLSHKSTNDVDINDVDNINVDDLERATNVNNNIDNNIDISFINIGNYLSSSPSTPSSPPSGKNKKKNYDFVSLQIGMNDFEKMINSENNLTIENDVQTFWEANSESSDSDEQDDDDDDEKENNGDIYKTFKKLTLNDLKSKMTEKYELDFIHKYSSAFDILALYINCYYIIYNEASSYCSFQLNLFMLPCIFFSTLCTVLVSLLNENNNYSKIIASLNGLIAFLLAVINYLKLDASSESHKISAYQYMKLKNYIEFASGEILLFHDPLLKNNYEINQQIKLWNKNHQNLSKEAFQIKKNEKIKELYEQRKLIETTVINNLKHKITEIKNTLQNIEENNNFILPRYITNKYYNIRNINIFSYIKNIEWYKYTLLNELLNIKNELRFYKKMDINFQNENTTKIVELYKKKNEILNNFFQVKNGYNLIETMIKQELLNIHLYHRYWHLFYMQTLINLITNNFNILPSNYKNSRHVGGLDKNNQYLLEKILSI
jgi:hypothetical protein